MVAPGVARAERLPLKLYTVADGLPNNVINKIVPDSRGFLWFCTAEGLSLFDGYRFTNYRTDDGLPHSNVTDVLKTAAGDYWVATSGGLVKFNPNGVPLGQVVDANGSRAQAPRDPMFAVLTPPGDDRYARSVTTLLEGRDGTIWCGTFRGLFRLTHTEGRAALLPVDIELPTEYPLSAFIAALHEDRHGTLWVGAATGLYRRWPDGSSARYGIKDGLPDENLHDLLEDRQGNLWVGTRLGGLLCLSTGAGREPPVITRVYNHKNGLTTNWVADLHESSDGKLWVGTNVGLAEFSSNTARLVGPTRMYTRRNGFNYHLIDKVTEDREGNLWLSTISGAMKIARNGFLTFGEQDGIHSVTSLFETQAGELYAYGYVIGDQEGSVFEGRKVDVLNPGSQKYWFSLGHFDGERFNWVLPNTLRSTYLSWSNKPFVIQASIGEWWFGRYIFPRVSSFAELKTARPISVPTGPQTGDPVVYCLYEDSRGNVWISTAGSAGNRLTLWERATRSERDLAGTEGLPHLKEILPVSFQEDAAGNVWVGFNNNDGLARYSAGRFSVFTTDHGLPPGMINDLYLDHSGRLWIATTRGGLARIDDPTSATPAFIRYSTLQGLSSDVTNAITEDLQGRIYVGTGRGIDRITTESGRIKHFTTADGLAPGEVVTALRDRRGALWFGTIQGLSRFIPQQDEPSLAPPILISSLSLASGKYTVSALGETDITLPDLSANENQIRIEFVGLSFAPGEALRYQYKLEGTDMDWAAPTEQRTVNLAGLSPGQYRFLVSAITSDGVVSPQPATVTFTILPPLWQRWWFLAAIAGVLIVTAYALYRYRMARILELASVRTHIATDLHDDIGANLTKIAILSEVVKQELDDGKGDKHDSLSSIAQISRESVAAMSDIVWAVDPQRDSLRDLVRRMRQHAEEVLVTRDIKLEFAAPEPNLKLGAEFRRDLFLILKEAVNNAVRHSGCSEVEIALTIIGQRLELKIKDNGVGFNTEAPSDGQGLSNMRERARKLGGEFECISVSSGGTEIRIRVPYARAALRTPRTSLK